MPSLAKKFRPFAEISSGILKFRPFAEILSGILKFRPFAEILSGILKFRPFAEILSGILKFRPFADILFGVLLRRPSPKSFVHLPIYYSASFYAVPRQKVSSICRDIIRCLHHLHSASFYAVPRQKVSSIRRPFTPSLAKKFRPFAEISSGILKFRPFADILFGALSCPLSPKSFVHLPRYHPASSSFVHLPIYYSASFYSVPRQKVSSIRRDIIRCLHHLHSASFYAVPCQKVSSICRYIIRRPFTPSLAKKFRPFAEILSGIK